MHPRAHFVQGTAEAAAGAALIEGVARHCSWSTKQKEMLGATRGGASSITSADDNRERCRGQLRPLLQLLLLRLPPLLSRRSLRPPKPRSLTPWRLQRQQRQQRQPAQQTEVAALGAVARKVAQAEAEGSKRAERARARSTHLRGPCPWPFPGLGFSHRGTALVPYLSARVSALFLHACGNQIGSGIRSAMMRAPSSRRGSALVDVVLVVHRYCRAYSPFPLIEFFGCVGALVLRIALRPAVRAGKAAGTPGDRFLTNYIHHVLRSSGRGPVPRHAPRTERK